MLGTIDIWHSDVPSPTGWWNRRGSGGWVEWEALEDAHPLPGEREGEAPGHWCLACGPCHLPHCRTAPRFPSYSAVAYAEAPLLLPRCLRTCSMGAGCQGACQLQLPPWLFEHPLNMPLTGPTSPNNDSSLEQTVFADLSEFLSVFKFFIIEV